MLMEGEMAFFDAAEVMKELRETFASGKTKSYEWRVSQLKALIKLAEYHEGEIVEALRSDLSKPELESFLHEVFIIRSILINMKLSCFVLMSISAFDFFLH